MVASNIIRMSGFLFSFALLLLSMTPFFSTANGESLRATVVARETTKDLKFNQHRNLQVATEQFDIDDYRNEVIEIVVSTSDVSGGNIDKAETQTRKSLQKALQKFMRNSSVFERKLERYAGIVNFEAPDKESIEFGSPSTSTLTDEITVSYAMPSFSASFRYDNSNNGDDVEEDVADALVDSLKDDIDVFEDYFLDDFKQNNWTFDSLTVKRS